MIDIKIARGWKQPLFKDTQVTSYLGNVLLKKIQPDTFSLVSAELLTWKLRGRVGRDEVSLKMFNQNAEAASAALPRWPSVECFWPLEILFHPGAPSAGGTAGRWGCLGWWSGSLWCWLHPRRPCPGSCWKNPESKEHKWLAVERGIISGVEKKKKNILKTASASHHWLIS